MTRSIVAAMLVAASVFGCGADQESPEAEVRAWLESAEAAAEARDRGALLDLVSDAYADGRGNDKEDIGNMLRFYFFRQQNVSLLTRVEELRLQGATAAHVSLFVGMAGTTNTAFGLRADAYNLELELASEDGDWRLIGARWGDIGGELR
jgi:hypothetical protein